jgi:DNA polymerase III alpha subunit
MRRAFDLLREHKGEEREIATIPMNDGPTYRMIQKADTIGVFQIESRAQMAMLPRIKPKIFYDLVIQVAIVRPGATWCTPISADGKVTRSLTIPDPSSGGFWKRHSACRSSKNRP